MKSLSLDIETSFHPALQDPDQFPCEILEERERKIQEFKKQIENGAYKIKSEKIVEALLRIPINS